MEDDERLARAIVRGLRKHGFAVDHAGDGDSALFQAETNNYDLLILDVMVPKRDGFEVCGTLRANGVTAPILFLTARDSVDDRVHGLDLGADDYLVKPFDFAEFLARVRALTRRRSELRSAELAVGDLLLDVGSRAATRDGRSVELTTKEFAVLEYLVDHAGRIVTRTELAEHVWDENYDPFSNVIEVYIRRLRRKIDAQAEYPLIHTRRGSGYIVADLRAA